MVTIFVNLPISKIIRIIYIYSFPLLYSLLFLRLYVAPIFYKMIEFCSFENWKKKNYYYYYYILIHLVRDLSLIFSDNKIQSEVFVHTFDGQLRMWCICVYIYVCIYVCICVYICMYLYIKKCIDTKCTSSTVCGKCAWRLPIKFLLSQLVAKN